MIEPPIYTLKDVSLSFGNKPLFENVELYINQKDKISLVGRNGSGKSTLLKIIAGVIEPDNGEIFIQPNVKIGYMEQDADLSKYPTLRDVVLSGLDSHDENMEYKAQILIDKLQIAHTQDTNKASGGEKRKASLGKALVSEPDILLLDEPTNHLDMPTIEILEQIIKEYNGAVLTISHDKQFLSNTSHTTLWLDRGTIRRNNKGFGFFEEWQDQVIEQEIIAQKYLNKKIAEETEWLHKGVTARRKRNMGRLRRLQQLRQDRKEQIKQIGSANLEVENSIWKSKLVIEAKNISKSFGDRSIIKDFSTKIIRGNKIGIVGPNGAGKTTLIKALTKKIEPDSGFVRIGKNLEEAYFDQNRITLDNSKTLWKTLCNEGDHVLVRGKYRHVVAYLKDFLFSPDQAQSPVASLSGGEKNRLILAQVLAQPSNFLVLDEPTNDLDMDTLDMLQDVLSEYSGTVLLISHDRSFLDNIVTSIIYMKGDGSIEEHVGGYTSLLEKINSTKLPTAKIAKKKPSNSIKKEATKKLSYSQQRLLDVLPTQIEELEKNIAEIALKLSDANLYTNNKDKFDELSNDLKNLQAQKDDAENNWIELSIIKEEIESTSS